MADEVNGKVSRNILAMVREKAGGVASFSIVRQALWQAAALGGSFLVSRVPFLSGVYPFGLAFMIGVPDKFSIAALIGFVLSAWTGGTVVGANSSYISAVGVVAALRWILAGMSRGKYRKSNYLPCLVAGVASVTITELAILALTGTFSWQSAGRLAGGVALAAAFSYFYHISFYVVRKRQAITELTSYQKASLALTLSTVLMAFYPVNVGPFSLGRLLAGLCCLLAAYLLNSPLDAAVFAAGAAAISITEPAFVFAGAGLCVAGVMSSLFKKKGKAWMCLIFIVCAALLMTAANNYVYSLTYISEILFCSLLFLVVPVKGVGDMKFIRLNDSLTSATAAISIKLESISASMRDVTGLLDKAVPASRTISMGELYSQSVEAVCRDCPHAPYCWVRCYDDSNDALNRLTPLLTERGRVSREDFTPPFSLRCTNMAGLARDINERYQSLMDTKSRHKTTGMYKDMIKKQFIAVSDMLDSAREELTSYREWDEVRSKRIYDCAVRLALPVETAGCIYDDAGQPVVTVALRDTPPDSLIRRLTAGIGTIVGTQLSAPSIEMSNGNTVLCFTKRPTFNVRTAASQVSAEGSRCGDVYSIFSDLDGRVHILLSDGMGTGEQAAREGTICCAFLKRLLETGFPIKRAAELANSALAIREDTESASTIDVLSVNVFDGTATLFKAGAAPTFYLRGSEVKCIEGQSLPVGILEEVVSKQFDLELADGDIAVLTSDGIQMQGYGLVADTLKTSFGATPEEICREIIRRARDRGDLKDDVTVIVVKVTLHAEDSAE